MANIPETLYPGKVAPSTADYPYGGAQNITVSGDGTGTPWEAALVNDLFGQQQALLSAAGVVPSGTPETALVSQYLNSMYVVSGRKLKTIADLRATEPTKDRECSTIMGHTTSGIGFGMFYYDAADAVTLDDDGTVVVTPGGARWKRLYDNQFQSSWFNATGDGATDDTTALQVAIIAAETAVLAGTCGGISFEGGHFITSATLNFVVPMVVNGGNASFYWETSGNSDVIYVNAGGNTAGFVRNKWTMRDFTAAGGDGTGAVLHIDTVSASIFENINIPFGGYGVLLENSLLNEFTRVVVSGVAVTPANPDTVWYPAPAHRNRKGFFCIAGPVTGPNLNTFTQCGVQNSTEEGLRIIGGNNMHFIDYDSEGHTGEHLHSDGCINLQFTGGDFEGTSVVSFLNCIGGGIKGAFVNHIVRVEGTGNSVVIEGGLIKIIDIAAATCNNTIVDNVTLYTGASGITDNGTNTRIGRVYDQDSASPYFGREWEKVGAAVVDVGGTTAGHVITKNIVNVSRRGGLAYVHAQFTWSSLAGAGAISFDISGLLDVTTAGAISGLTAIGLRVTTPANFGDYYARITTPDKLELLFKTAIAGGADALLTKADIFGAATGVTITGVIEI